MPLVLHQHMCEYEGIQLFPQHSEEEEKIRAMIHIRFFFFFKNCSNMKMSSLLYTISTSAIIAARWLLRFQFCIDNTLTNFTSWFGIGQWVHVKWKLLSSHETLSVHSHSCSIVHFSIQIKKKSTQRIHKLFCRLYFRFWIFILILVRQIRLLEFFFSVHDIRTNQNL